MLELSKQIFDIAGYLCGTIILSSLTIFIFSAVIGILWGCFKGDNNERRSQ